MTSQAIVRKAKKYLDANSSLILTVIGSVGVVATAVMAVKATPKAIKLIEKRKKEENRELEPVEVIETSWKCYVSTALIGMGTISCIFGSHVLNKRKQASLINSYILLEQYFKEYKRSVKKLYGDEVDIEIRSDMVKEKLDEKRDPNKHLFFLEPYGKYFESTMEDVLMAEYNLNRKFAKENEASLNDFLEYLGLPKKDKTYNDGYNGWSKEVICDFCNPDWIDFHHNLVQLEDGMECYLINPSVEPRFIFNDFPADYNPYF